MTSQNAPPRSEGLGKPIILMLIVLALGIGFALFLNELDHNRKPGVTHHQPFLP